VVQLRKFEACEFLTEEETIAEYLNAALEGGKPAVFLAAMGQVAKARGMGRIAEQTGLGRESLYKTLTPGAKPRIETVMKVLQSMGLRFSVGRAVVAPPAGARRRRAANSP
jgi:probable addiction module antidote protein